MAEEYINHGNWAIGDLGIVFGAMHTQKFDELMTAYRLLQKAVAEDEPRIRRLPRPWLGDPHHNDLKRKMNAARAKCVEYVIKHPDIVIVGSR